MKRRGTHVQLANQLHPSTSCNEAGTIPVKAFCTWPGINLDQRPAHHLFILESWRDASGVWAHWGLTRDLASEQERPLLVLSLSSVLSKVSLTLELAEPSRWLGRTLTQIHNSTRDDIFAFLCACLLVVLDFHLHCTLQRTSLCLLLWVFGRQNAIRQPAVTSKTPGASQHIQYHPIRSPNSNHHALLMSRFLFPNDKFLASRDMCDVAPREMKEKLRQDPPSPPSAKKMAKVRALQETFR